MKVHQSEDGITMSQSAYALKIEGLDNCNPCEVPMDARLRLSKLSKEP